MYLVLFMRLVEESKNHELVEAGWKASAIAGDSPVDENFWSP